MNRFLLYLIMLPKVLWARLGADPVQFQALLDVRLKLDDRKPAQFGRARAEKKPRRFASLLAAFVALATGVMYLFPLHIIEDKFSGLWMYFTMFLFLLSIMLITDFSTVLIDTRDKYVVLPRPVGDRTLFLARMLHIFIYLFRIVLPMSLPGWVYIGLTFGWKAAVLFPLPVFLVTLTALFLVMGIYLIMLRTASASRFKEALSYFQIAFSIIIFATYYLVPRGADSEAFRTFDIHKHIWGSFTPPYWLAAMFRWVHPFAGAHLGLIALLAVLLPMLFFALTIKWLAPAFTARLGALDAIESGDAPTAKTTRKMQGSRAFYQKLARWLNIRPEAQAGFIMAWIQTGRSRGFKMRVYPMFAYVPIYFVFLLTQSHRPVADVWASLPGSGKHIVLLYMCSIVMLQGFAFMSISEGYKASWIYRAVPLAEPGAILLGAAKVIWIKYFLPFFAAISVFVITIWGPIAISDVALALVNVTLFAACVLRTAYRKFPFSQLDQATSTSGSRFLRAMLGMIIPTTLGVAHYFSLYLPWLKIVFLVLSSILLWLVWDSYAHTDWTAMKREED